MTVRVCSHRLSMQSDVLNDPQQQISNDTDGSSSLSTTLIYSGLKLVCLFIHSFLGLLELFI